MRYVRVINVKLPKHFFLLIIFLCLSLILIPVKSFANQSQEERKSELVEGAKKEGNLLFYTTLSTSDADKLLKKFENKYPFIKTSMYRTGDDSLMARIMAETQSKNYRFDTVCLTGISGELLKKKGITTKYVSPESKFFVEGSKDPEGYWTDIYMNLYTLGYNTRLVSPQDVPKTWTDLLKPVWKGKMGMDSKSFYWLAAMLKYMGEEKGLEYMKALAQQKIQFRHGQPTVNQLMAAGEVSLGVTLYNHIVEAIKVQGAPVEWVALDPIIPQIHPLSISAHAPHPNAARLFVDYLLSRDGQELMASFFRIPARMDVDPIVPRLKKGLKIMPFDFSIEPDYDRYIKLYRKIFLNY